MNYKSKFDDRNIYCEWFTLLGYYPVYITTDEQQLRNSYFKACNNNIVKYPIDYIADAVMYCLKCGGDLKKIQYQDYLTKDEMNSIYTQLRRYICG